MSLPTDPLSDPLPDPHADPLVASVLRAAADAPTVGCPDAELLALYAERALDASDLALVQPHLDGCPRCQAVVAACVRALPDASEPSSAPAGAFDTGARGRSWFADWRWLVPITSVATVAVVAVWIGRGPSDRVAEQASTGELTRESPVPGTSADSARSAPAAEAEADRRASTSLRRSADGLGREEAANGTPPTAAGRQDAAREDGFAAALPSAVQAKRLRERDEPLPARSEEARAKTAAAAPASDARRLADAAPAPPPAVSTYRAPAAGAPAAAPVAAAPQAANAVGAAREAAMATLTGTVTYRARVALPPGAVIEVRLLDVSRADPSTSLRAGAPADTLARADIVTRGEQVPVPFSLPYDPDTIQARRRYVVQATIAVEGRIAWRTTTPHPVFVDGAAPTTPVIVIVDAIR